MNNRYRRSYVVLSFLVVMLLTACAALAPSTSAEPTSQSAQPTAAISPPPTDTPIAERLPPTNTSAAFDETRLANLTYRLETLAEVLPDSDGSVPLADGHFEQALADSSGGVTVDLIRSARGDLNRDGVEDGLALLALNSGGSGTFLYLVAVINQAGEPQQAASLFLGDRVDVQSMLVQDGGVRVTMLTHASDDPLCCPTLQENREYRLENNRLVTPEQSQVLPLAESTIQALKNRDMAALASLAHPQNGVRFSPYSYVLPEHLSFAPESLATLLDDPNTYTWGTFDGSGEPIQMTFKDYFERFVYSKDFASAGQVSLDQRLGRGNTIDNSHEYFPGSVVVEYYLPGENPEYGGLDWQSLRLVFQQVDGKWYLAGVIHDEWTI